MIKRLPAILVLFFLLALISTTTFAQERTPNFKFTTVVIDPGHGGKDPGAHGAYSLEKNVALAIAKKVNLLMQSTMPGIKVIMTRSSDKFIPLDRRAGIANENKANLFISIHCNSSPPGTGPSNKGVMLLVYGFHRKDEQIEALRENSSIYIEKDYQKKYDGYSETDPTALIVLNTFMEKYRKQSILFGGLVNKELIDNGRRSRGVKEQGVLVLAHSAMPAVLVETGYINNPGEEAYLNSTAGQQAIADAIVKAIKRYRDKVDTE